MKVFQTAISRGIFFELEIGQVFHPSEPFVRGNVIANMKKIIELTKGRNIIISLSAEDSIQLRGPYDVINLLVLLGIDVNQSKKFISNNVSSLLSYATTRKLQQSAATVSTIGSLSGNDSKSPTEKVKNKKKKGNQNNQKNPNKKQKKNETSQDQQTKMEDEEKI